MLCIMHFANDQFGDFKNVFDPFVGTGHDALYFATTYAVGGYEDR